MSAVTSPKKRVNLSYILISPAAVILLVLSFVGGVFIVDFLHSRSLFPSQNVSATFAKDADPVAAGPVVPVMASPQQMTVDVSQLDTDNAIRFVKGDGSRILYLFGNPECPLSKKMQIELDKLDNVTIFAFLVPGESDATRNHAARVLCEGQMLSGLACDENALDLNEQAMTDLGLGAIPTIITPTGEVMQGLAPANILEAILTLQVKHEGRA